jgi:hypothetical protein
MRVACLGGVRITVRHERRQWKGEAPRVIGVCRVDDGGNLEQLLIDCWPGTNAPAIRLGNSGWIMLGDLMRLEYFDWEPAAAPHAPADDDALDPWLRLYPELLEQPRRPGRSFEP